MEETTYVQKKKSHSKKIAGIILAAGTGKRMKKTKQLLNCKGKFLLQKVICSAKASKLDHIIVILGYNSKKILKKINFSKTEPIINFNYKKGQSSSIKKGILSLNNFFHAAMFLLGDQPLINKKIINKLINAYPYKDNSKIITPVYKQLRGNPIIFGRNFFYELSNLTGDTGGRELINKYQSNTIKVKIKSNAIFFDLDTYEDYKKLYKSNFL